MGADARAPCFTAVGEFKVPPHESGGMAAAPPPKPKFLKGAYLAETEGLLKETRATALFYLPGAVLAVAFFGFLEWVAATARYPDQLRPIPYLTDWFSRFPSLGLGQDSVLVLFFGLVLLISLLWLLVRYLRWISTVYAVTTHRVIVQRGILGREFDEIPIPQVRGVDVKQSAFQRLLRYGTVRVSSEPGSAASIGNEDWHVIPRPFDFQRLIEAANQAISRGAYAPPTNPYGPGPSYGNPPYR